MSKWRGRIIHFSIRRSDRDVSTHTFNSIRKHTNFCLVSSPNHTAFKKWATSQFGLFCIINFRLENPLLMSGFSLWRLIKIDKNCDRRIEAAIFSVHTTSPSGTTMVARMKWRASNSTFVTKTVSSQIIHFGHLNCGFVCLFMKSTCMQTKPFNALTFFLRLWFISHSNEWYLLWQLWADASTVVELRRAVTDVLTKNKNVNKIFKGSAFRWTITTSLNITRLTSINTLNVVPTELSSYTLVYCMTHEQKSMFSINNDNNNRSVNCCRGWWHR